jgi:hypothetical protein
MGMPKPPSQMSSNPDSAGVGPVPVENQLGHHPDVEQDKPSGPPPRPRRVGPAAERPSRQRFSFRFNGSVGIAARAFVLSERRAEVVIDGDREQLIARYGWWAVATPLANIAAVSVTGPYRVWKVIGPPHISFQDRGLTFATNSDLGVCIRFHEPVKGIDPRGFIRHPGLTVTVDDPVGLVAALQPTR